MLGNEAIGKSKMPSLSELEEAVKLVRRYVPATPQFCWPLLTDEAGCELWIKHENHTPTGSFKMRGGLVYMDWLRRAHPDVTGESTATRGNHGQSIAFAARHFGLKPVVVVPHGNSREKNDAMRAPGAELIEHGEDFHDADHLAEELAGSRKLFRVPAFDLLLVGLALMRWNCFQRSRIWISFTSQSDGARELADWLPTGMRLN